MSDIVVRRGHHLPVKKARAAAQKIAARLDQEFDVDYVWKGDTLQFRRTGVTGHLAVDADSVEISIRLGLLLLPLRRRIEEEIHAYFDEFFGKAGGPPA